jgi:hypothetical protein
MRSDAIRPCKGMGSKNAPRCLQLEKRRGTSREDVLPFDDVLPFMVCPVVDDEASFPPLMVGSKPSERNRWRPARSPAVSSVAPKAQGPGMTCRETDNGVAALALDVQCGILRHIPTSARSAREVSFDDAAPGIVPRRAPLSREVARYRTCCRVGALLAAKGSSVYLCFRRPLCRRKKLLGVR